MDVELIVALLVLLSILVAVWVLLPKRSGAPARRITSSRNGYGRGWGQ